MFIVVKENGELRRHETVFRGRVNALEKGQGFGTGIAEGVERRLFQPSR